MEASVAAQGQAQAGESAEAQSQQQGQQQGSDFEQLQQQLAAVAGGQDELRQMLLAAQEAGGDDGGTEETDLLSDLSWLDVDAPDFDPQVVAQRLAEAVDQAAEQKVQPVMQRLDAFEAQAAEQQRVAEAERLVEEFPELREREVALEVVSTARQLAEAQFPPQVAKVMAESPAFWRLIYMAGRAADAANAEGQDPQAAVLESGTGARPGAGPTADELGEQIVSSRRGRSVLPF